MFPRRTARLLADALSLSGATRAAFEMAARGFGEIGARCPRSVAGARGRLLPQRPRSRCGPPAAWWTSTPIDGMAGVGKSAFAVHAAHALASRFLDDHV